jgi:hypothetical protein
MRPPCGPPGRGAGSDRTVPESHRVVPPPRQNRPTLRPRLESHHRQLSATRYPAVGQAGPGRYFNFRGRCVCAGSRLGLVMRTATRSETCWSAPRTHAIPLRCSPCGALSLPAAYAHSFLRVRVRGRGPGRGRGGARPGPSPVPASPSARGAHPFPPSSRFGREKRINVVIFSYVNSFRDRST